MKRTSLATSSHSLGREHRSSSIARSPVHGLRSEMTSPVTPSTFHVTPNVVSCNRVLNIGREPESVPLHLLWHSKTGSSSTVVAKHAQHRVHHDPAVCCGPSALRAPNPWFPPISYEGSCPAPLPLQPPAPRSRSLPPPLANMPLICMYCQRKRPPAHCVSLPTRQQRFHAALLCATCHTLHAITRNHVAGTTRRS